MEPGLDGISVWQALSTDTPSDRKEILHNIDDIYGSAAVTRGDWKVVKGTNYRGQWDNWYGPAGSRDPRDYDINAILNCAAGKAINDMRLLPSRSKIM